MADSGATFGDGEDHRALAEAAIEAVARLINQVQPGSMVQRFVLLVEAIDDEDRWISAFTAPDQKRWDTMGLLEYGMTLERNIVLVTGGEDPDED